MAAVDENSNSGKSREAPVKTERPGISGALDKTQRYTGYAVKLADGDVIGALGTAASSC